MKKRMCPYVEIHMSLCKITCVPMTKGMCPHVRYMNETYYVWIIITPIANGHFYHNFFPSVTFLPILFISSFDGYCVGQDWI